MRYSKFFSKTRHDAPCDADSVNAKFLTQAGFVEKMAAGIYNYLPMGQRVLRKIQQIVREEMDGIDGQEILMPSLHPLELWKTTGRDKTMDDILYRTTANGNKEFVFGPSHEEAVTPLAARYIQSYKDLPLSVYQIQTKFRDEPRAKSGLLRGREFGMKDMYSFHVSDADLDAYYDRAIGAYTRVFERCGLHAHIIEASGGAFTDKISHEFSVETVAGEDTVIVCDKCKKSQNSEVATGKVKDGNLEEEAELKEVDVERGFSVKDNAVAHGVEPKKILKTVVYEVEGKGLVGVVIRGDLAVNELKLQGYFGTMVRPASAATLVDAGLVQGYISPVNMPDGVDISFVGDHTIKSLNNYVTGANEQGKDYANANLGRDFEIGDFGDFVEVNGDFVCEDCDSPLQEIKAVEAGNIFKLGTIYSDAFGLSFTDSDGKSKPVIMGCYGIGITRLMGTVVEASHDDNGIIWPMSVAPYQVHLVSLANDDTVTAACDELYDTLQEAGIEVLYDDRDERAGVKFKDADLIGVPLRLVVSKRTLESNSAEWKERASADASSVDLTELVSKVKEFVTA